GTLRATTVAELAKRAGLELPRPADKLYQWPDFYGFLDVLRLTALVLRTPADFARAVYEYAEDAARDGNLRHVEFFFNPDYFYPNGIDYPAMVDGMIEGIEAARKKFRVSSLLICCIDRSTNTPSQAVEIVEAAIAHRRDLVVGIGLDGAERAGPPATFAQAYALARRAGLHRTAHGRSGVECHHQHRRPGHVRDQPRPWIHDLVRLDRVGTRHGAQIQPELDRGLVARRKRQERAQDRVPPRDRGARQGVRLRDR